MRFRCVRRGCLANTSVVELTSGPGFRVLRFGRMHPRRAYYGRGRAAQLFYTGRVDFLVSFSNRLVVRQYESLRSQDADYCLAHSYGAAGMVRRLTFSND